MTASSPRIGLVLGAGGSTGAAFHAGVLAALHDGLGWDARTADVVVGTSAGSMAGAALRAGLAPGDFYARTVGASMSSEGERLLRSMPPVSPRSFPLRPRLQSRNAQRPSAAALARMAIGGARPLAMASAFLPPGQIPIADLAASFDPLFRAGWPRATFWVCAVQLSSGKRVVFGRDAGARPPVATAVAASCAIPGVFAPVSIDGIDHVDGGVHSPTNLDLVSQLDVDLVIVSSPMSMAGRGVWRRADYAIRRACRAMLDQEAMRVRRRGVPVVAFQPTLADADVMGVNAMDPRRRAAVARQVRDSTLARLERADVRARLAAVSSGVTQTRA